MNKLLFFMVGFMDPVAFIILVWVGLCFVVCVTLYRKSWKKALGRRSPHKPSTSINRK